jgi:hypothetical protein
MMSDADTKEEEEEEMVVAELVVYKTKKEN